jgi:Ni,Fe-hydrogenase I large subunit
MELNKLLDIVGIFADKKNPKSELNYILVDGKKLVSTDTYLMFIVDYELENNEGAQVLLDTGKSTGLNINTLVAGKPATTEGKFPEYQRIQSKEKIVIHETESIQEALAFYPHYAGEKTGYIDLIGFAPRLKKLQLVTKKVEVLKLSCAEAPITLRLTLLGGIKAELIVMPVTFAQERADKE